MASQAPNQFTSDSRANLSTIPQTRSGSVDDQDRRVWELITEVPRLGTLKAYGCAILNIFFAGTGTMLSAFLSDEPSFSKTQLVVGLLQLLTSIYIIGWLLSLYWALKLITKSAEVSRGEQSPLVYAKQTNSQMNPYAVSQ